jgi:rubredoxin
MASYKCIVCGWWKQSVISAYMSARICPKCRVAQAGEEE